jgi:molybdenum cofactor biosynthesis enzyme MoaA
MKTHTFSIVVGTAECDAKCPYCVSKMTMTKAAKRREPINWGRFDSAMRIVEMAADGLVSVLLTGKGEPTLYPEQITEYLHRMEGRFPLVDLQTNGINVTKMPYSQLNEWRELGLSLACVSITHPDPHISNDIMGCPTDYNFWDAIHRCQDVGLATRLNCTLVKGGCDSFGEIDELIYRCKEQGVDQLTIRAVSKPKVSKARGPFDWVVANQPAITGWDLYSRLDSRGTKLLELPHGAFVFDVDGQNVCVGNCLTGTTDPEDIRQIIFFPDGRVCYDWQYPGARIL